MKQSFVFSTVAMVVAGFMTTSCSAQQTINVFLVGGQSNADGRANPSDLPPILRAPQQDVPVYYGLTPSLTTTITKEEYTTLRPGLSYKEGQFGPEVSFGRSMADFYKAKGGSIALIKYATGGSTLAQNWKAGGDATISGDGPNYQNFQTIVKNGLAKLKEAFPDTTITISGMIWMQGESDCNPSRSGQYEANLTAYINDIRATYGANLPFVIGQLSAHQTGTNQDAHGTDEDRSAIWAAQETVVSKLLLTALVKTESFALNKDNLHFNGAGQKNLGLAFATQMQDLAAKALTKR